MKRKRFLTSAALSVAGLLSGNQLARSEEEYEIIKKGLHIRVYTVGYYRIHSRKDKSGLLDKNDLLIDWRSQSGREWFIDRYLETVNRDEVIKKIEEWKDVLNASETIAGFLGFPNPLGISLEKLIDFTPELSPEYANVSRWDIYRRSSGTMAGNRPVTINTMIFFVPSNIPEVRDLQVQTTNSTAHLIWSYFDRHKYPHQERFSSKPHIFTLPDFPEAIDPTAYAERPVKQTWKGSTVEIYSLNGENRKQLTEDRDFKYNWNKDGMGISITNIQQGQYEAEVQVKDNVGNLSDIDRIRFTIGQQFIQQPQRPTPTNDRQSIEDIVREFIDMEKGQEDGHISEDDITRYTSFYNTHITEALARKGGLSTRMSREEAKRRISEELEKEGYTHGIRHKTTLEEESIKINLQGDRATAYFDVSMINTVPPPLQPSGTSTSRIRFQFDLLEIGDTWKINELGGKPKN